jgi:excisionase family DNA binding protein
VASPASGRRVQQARSLPAVPLGGADVEWLTLGQAAKYLGVSESTVRKWSDEARFSAFSTPGGHRRFRRQDLDEFLDGARISGPGERSPVVLVVDADEQRRALVRFSLEAEGYGVLEAANARDGLAALDEEPPDLILLDILVPEVDGWEMLCRLRERHGLESIPVVMFAGAPSARGAGGAGAKRFIGRPDPLRLVEATRQLLEAHVPGANST